MKRTLALLLGLALAAGCGGIEKSGGPVTVTVSQDYGETRLAPSVDKNAKSGETVMELTRRSYDVVAGAAAIQEIGGVAAGREHGKPVGWFYYVNGIEATRPAQRKLYPNDRVWWDHHGRAPALRVPAVVGAFPEPFVSGTEGKKLPIKVVCLGAQTRSCDEVEARLQAAGIKDLARSNLESSVGQVLRILVGPWRQVRKDLAARTLESGPAASGVFARPDPSGSRIVLLDADGAPQKTLGPGSGLVAATSYKEQRPTWLITGTDEVGVAAAAAAVTEDQLHDHFALAIEAGRGVPLPVSTP
jgi:hypothetical protein